MRARALDRHVLSYASTYHLHTIDPSFFTFPSESIHPRMYRIYTPKNQASMLTRQTLVSAGLKLSWEKLILLSWGSLGLKYYSWLKAVPTNAPERLIPFCFSLLAGMGAFLTFTVSWIVEAITES